MALTSKLLFLTLIIYSYGLPEKLYQDAFVTFMQTYGRSYNHYEFQHRYQVFKQNLDFISAHNSQNKGTTLAINQFGDLTNEEFTAIHNGFKSTSHHNLGSTFTPQSKPLPDSFDWRDKGAVSHVKNQGSCGSCWSFSTTGSVEGCNAIKNGNLTPLSEQQLLDCSDGYGNNGCHGGLMTDAMDYIIASGGLDSESSYPYSANEGSCNFKTQKISGTITSYRNIEEGNEGDLKAAVFEGPTSIAIDARGNEFQFYQSGVYSSDSCSSTELDHGVLAVGWGSDPKGGDYWIVKNSWGDDWGMEGYVWMARNKNNACGVATAATIPEC